jgi:hypothetical protein
VAFNDLGRHIPSLSSASTADYRFPSRRVRPRVLSWLLRSSEAATTSSSTFAEPCADPFARGAASSPGQRYLERQWIHDRSI